MCQLCQFLFCLNILLRLDMPNTDLSPSPAPPLSLMPAQGALYFCCTGHQVFWGKVRRRAHEAAFTRAFPSFKFLIQIFFWIFFFLGRGAGGRGTRGGEVTNSLPVQVKSRARTPHCLPAAGTCDSENDWRMTDAQSFD